MQNGRPACATIELAALHHNLKRIQSYAPNSQILAIVKANAYGHGAITIAQALVTKVQGFGVACLAEALALRQAGIQQRVVVLEGFFKTQELAAIADYGIEIVVHSFAQIAMLNSARLPQAVSVWLKIDTGMHRLGFTVDQVAAAYQALAACQNVQQPIHWMTHFSAADNCLSTKTDQQLWRFKHLVPEASPGFKSLANSAAIISKTESHADYVRPGIMLYGASPFMHKTAADFKLMPVMTLSTELIAIKQVKAGESVGYNGEWVAAHDSQIGIAAIGYGDGYPLQAKSGTPVLVNGLRTGIVGRVSMDMLAVDLSCQPQAKIGDPVVLWGQGLPIEEVAASANTTAYQLLCGVSRRVEFKVQSC